MRIFFIFTLLSSGVLYAKNPTAIQPRNEAELKTLISSVAVGVSKTPEVEKSLFRQTLIVTDSDNEIEITIKMSGNIAHIKKVVDGETVEEYEVLLDRKLKQEAKRLLTELLNL